MVKDTGILTILQGILQLLKQVGLATSVHRQLFASQEAPCKDGSTQEPGGAFGGAQELLTCAPKQEPVWAIWAGGDVWRSRKNDA